MDNQLSKTFADIFNELLNNDPVAMYNIQTSFFPVTDETAENSDIVCQESPALGCNKQRVYTTSIIGIINGALRRANQNLIVYQVDEDETFIDFSVVSDEQMKLWYPED